MNKKYFDSVNSGINSKSEEEIFEYWKSNVIFDKSVQNRNDSPCYVFYDGPPFANGLPHYGHILTSYIKDTVPRYWTMKGRRIPRVFGWDCHGLPAENSTEKELGLNGKFEIEKYGIDKFNSHCRNSIMKYTKQWEQFMNRIGRWVDFDRGYKTMNIEYMESVMWIFKNLFDKGLIYEGNKILHYCTTCQTPLSNFEAKMDDAYRTKVDISITVKFELIDRKNTYFLVWTTTPWTLPSNLALAINSNLYYLTVELEGKRYIIEEHCIEKYSNLINENSKTIERILGKELIGIAYRPMFEYFEKNQNSFVVLEGDFVTQEDGTGIVHIAPAFGEDDFNLCSKNGIELVDPLDQIGKFMDIAKDISGLSVEEANVRIIEILSNRGMLFKKERYEHQYPFCWRCDSPLIYRAMPSWYLAVSKIKDNLIENNQKICWIPEYIKDGIFGKWLENAKDWAISRNRYWGSPIPVWKCSDIYCGNSVVCGSINEIENLSGSHVTDLHIPSIDKHVFMCNKCGKEMHRVKEVLDCWFESGSMPYAQLHYPFENKEFLEKNFPADFIVEYIAQTRGWFYTLLVISTALFNKNPFNTAIAHGVIFAEDGRKMSKRLENYPDPNLIIKKYGSDALRICLLSSAVTNGKNINFSESGVQDALKNIMLPLWNSYRFFVTYANADGFFPYLHNPHFKKGGNQKGALDNYLDRYILDKLKMFMNSMDVLSSKYEIARCYKEIMDFLEILNNVYIRRNRRRFWKSENTPDKIDAYRTLYEVIVGICISIAPYIPFLSETIYRNLTKKESVHLESIEEIDISNIDISLIIDIERVREIISIGRTIRENAKIKVREPRNSVSIIGIDIGNIGKYSDWIKEELNVKNLYIEETDRSVAIEKIRLDFKKLGSKYRSQLQEMIRAIEHGKYRKIEDNKIFLPEMNVSLESDEFSIEYMMPTGSMCTSDGKITVSIDLSESRELKIEGIARDIVRSIQVFRKDSGLDVSDRIFLCIESIDNDYIEATERFREYIMSETLAIQLEQKKTMEYIYKTENSESMTIYISIKE